jgi:hypothetical protein
MSSFWIGMCGIYAAGFLVCAWHQRQERMKQREIASLCDGCFYTKYHGVYWRASATRGVHWMDDGRYTPLPCECNK